MTDEEINLIEATQSDVDVFIDFERKVSDTKIYSTILDREEALKEFKLNKIYLIKRDNVTVGTVMYQMKGSDHAYISGLVVDPTVQRQGIGRTAMLLLLEQLKDVQRIDLVVHPENTSGLALYASLGFETESKQENYFRDGEPRLILVKRQ